MKEAVFSISMLLASINTFNKGIPESKFLINTPETIVLNVPFVHQIEDLPNDYKTIIKTTACGPASIAMALDFLGEKESLKDVIDKLPDTVYIKGKKFYNLYDGPKYFGKKSVVIGYTAKEIYEELSKEHPIILNVQNYDGITGHALVIVGIKNYKDEKAESLIVHDPFRAPYREFKFLTENTLQQPEGYQNTIGSLSPFYVIDSYLTTK
jgi:hypothetical protein